MQTHSPKNVRSRLDYIESCTTLCLNNQAQLKAVPGGQGYGVDCYSPGIEGPWCLSFSSVLKGKQAVLEGRPSLDTFCLSDAARKLSHSNAAIIRELRACLSRRVARVCSRRSSVACPICWRHISGPRRGAWICSRHSCVACSGRWRTRSCHHGSRRQHTISRRSSKDRYDLASRTKSACVALSASRGTGRQ